nr:putative ribonuclease H-like domain-containing protein [Tanacetum cinerariifolium]
MFILISYLLENGFQRGKIDQTLFIKKQKGDILLVQVYVDNIIFGSTNKELCTAFKKLMKDKFQMSYVRELTFILGLQVKQKTDGIFSSQDKYVAKILRKFGFIDVKSASTHTETEKPLLKDSDGEDVDIHLYMLMIRSLMYLTSFRPDIMFAVCAYARFQVTPKLSHLHAVKRIFRYLKGKTHLGLWYPRDSPFNLVAYYDSDYAGASLDRNSITKGCQFLGCRLISWQCKKQTVVATSSTKAEYVATASCCAQVLWIKNQLLDYGYELILFGLMEVAAVNLMMLVEKVNDNVQLQALIDDKKVVVTEAIIRRHLHLDDADGVECLPNAETFKKMHPNKRKIATIDADEGITLVDVETDEEEVAMDVKSQGRTNVNVASKGVSVVSAPELVSTAEPTVFDDEDVTMTMAQSLIKLKAEKAIIFDENIA